MYTLTINQDRYKTYTLSDSDARSAFVVVPERGGILTQWRVHDRDILYLDEARFADPTLSVRGGIPILFPICGNLPDNTYTYNGQPYTLKQHGFARDLPWDVVESGSEAQGRLVLERRSNEQTRAVYPFEFQLTFTYTLHDRTLLAQQRYTNHSAVPMPFSVGFHPYFQVTDKTQLAFDIPSDRLLDQRTKIRHAFDSRFDFEQDEIDVAFTDLARQSASVTDRGRSQRLTLDYSDTFSTLVFWTVKGKDFYCLEPWSAGRNAMNTGENLIHLAPGGSLETVFNLTVDFL